MNKLLSRWLPCATLATWSSVLLYFYFSHHINSLLAPTFRPYTLDAGIVMLMLAVCFVLFQINVDACTEDDFSAKSFGRQTTGRILTFLILLLPICAAATFSKNSYGASTVLNRMQATSDLPMPAKSANTTPYVEPPLPTADGSQPAPQAQSQSQPPPAESDEIQRSKEGNMIVQVVDLLYAAQDSTLQPDFKGQNIEMIGQLMPDTMNNPKGDRFKLVRMFMVCCAADARPVAVLVESPTKPAGADMSWIKIVGTVEFPVENGRTIAVVKASKVVATDPPEETMLY
jgi:uncharacterized repeat protein (TIGR03943 family)